VLHYLGRSDECIAVARAGVAAAQRLHSPALEALFVNAISVASFQTTSADALRPRKASRDLRCHGQSERPDHGAVQHRREPAHHGDLDAAERALRDGLRRARDLEDREMATYPLLNLAQVAWRRGDGAATLALAEEGLAISRAIDSRLKTSGALYWLGNAQLLLGRTVEAGRGFATRGRSASSSTIRNASMPRPSLARIALADRRHPLGARPCRGDPRPPRRWRLAGGKRHPGADLADLLFVPSRPRGDPRAAATLTLACQRSSGRAAGIADPSRRATFLALAEHRETLEAAAAGFGTAP
jgi:hypothetical protein